MRGFHLHHYSYTSELFKHRTQCLELGITFQSAYIFSLNVVLEELRLLTKGYSITAAPRAGPWVLVSDLTVLYDVHCVIGLLLHSFALFSRFYFFRYLF